MKDTELGKVHYCTLMLTFPGDKDQWVQQSPIAGSSVEAIHRFIQNLQVTESVKYDLSKNLKAEWKDHNGVWHTLMIETQPRRHYWGDTRSKRKRIT